jgi:hypothetical protein
LLTGKTGKKILIKISICLAENKGIIERKKIVIRRCKIIIRRLGIKIKADNLLEG